MGNSYEIVLSGALKEGEEDCLIELCSQMQADTKGRIIMISYAMEEDCFKYIFEYGGVLSISVDGSRWSFEGILDD